MSGGRTFVDTNVLVHLVDATDPGKQNRSRELVGALVDEGTLVLSTQVLLELYATATRKLDPRLPEPVALQMVDGFSKCVVVPADGALVLRAVRRGQVARLSVRDAMIVEAALEAGCSRILSEDLHDGGRVGGPVIENAYA